MYPIACELEETYVLHPRITQRILQGRLGEEAITKFGITSVAMAHRTGKVGPSEPIVSIHVASPHRAEGFEACSWLIDELKAQAPLWKKEIRADGTVWKGGLG